MLSSIKSFANDKIKEESEEEEEEKQGDWAEQIRPSLSNILSSEQKISLLRQASIKISPEEFDQMPEDGQEELLLQADSLQDPMSFDRMNTFSSKKSFA